MKQPKLLSLQHMARIWKPTPDAVKREILRLLDSTPPFTYEPLYKLLLQQARFGDSIQQLMRCLDKREKRPKVLEDFRAILSLVGGRLDACRPRYAHEVSEQHYNAGRDLFIPFRPPMVLGYPEKSVLPWLIFWKDRSLNQRQLSLFVTLVREQMDQNPDLENCDLEIWDCGRPDKQSPRDLTIMRAGEISLLPSADVRTMLDIFAEGFLLAVAEAQERAASQPSQEKRPQSGPDLFSTE